MFRSLGLDFFGRKEVSCAHSSSRRRGRAATFAALKCGSSWLSPPTESLIWRKKSLSAQAAVVSGRAPSCITHTRLTSRSLTNNGFGKTRHDRNYRTRHERSFSASPYRSTRWFLTGNASPCAATDTARRTTIYETSDDNNLNLPHGRMAQLTIADCRRLPCWLQSPNGRPRSNRHRASRTT